MTSTRMDAASGRGGATVRVAVDTAKRAVKLKLEPWPTVLSTQMRPPISSTSFLEMVSPRPVPP